VWSRSDGRQSTHGCISTGFGGAATDACTVRLGTLATSAPPWREGGPLAEWYQHTRSDQQANPRPHGLGTAEWRAQCPCSHAASKSEGTGGPLYPGARGSAPAVCCGTCERLANPYAGLQAAGLQGHGAEHGATVGPESVGPEIGGWHASSREAGGSSSSNTTGICHSKKTRNRRRAGRSWHGLLVSRGWSEGLSPG
jgi:hypothetical protein